MTTFLGIDYGSRRIGLSLGRSQTKLATPLITLKNDHTLLDQINQICQNEKVELIVLGLPRGLDGQDTAQTHVVRQFKLLLEDKLPLPVELQDEAVTSELAAERLQAQGGRKEDIDQMAAAIILQDYLDSRC